jgi:hypothetical protein
MKHTVLTFISFFCLLMLSFSSADAACSLPIKTPFSAVALFKGDLLGWVENNNRLKEICPTQDKACVAAALAAKTDTLAVYDRPSGKVIAILKIIYVPGEGIRAVLMQKKRSFSFVPTVHDVDWGYGPWFHATLLDQRGAWKEIALPQIKSGWVALPEAEVLHVAEKGKVYSLHNRHIVVIDSTDSSLTVRDEQPSDMWCEAGEPPPVAAFKARIIPLSRLYDDQCNLLVLPAYTRGC